MLIPKDQYSAIQVSNQAAEAPWESGPAREMFSRKSTCSVGENSSLGWSCLLLPITKHARGNDVKCQTQRRPWNCSSGIEWLSRFSMQSLSIVFFPTQSACDLSIFMTLWNLDSRPSCGDFRSNWQLSKWYDLEQNGWYDMRSSKPVIIMSFSHDF